MRLTLPLLVLATLPMGAITAAAVPPLTTPPPTVYTDCDTLWAMTYAHENGLNDCDERVIDCDTVNDPADPVADDSCNANELLDEFYDDPLFGERVDTTGNGEPDTFPGDIVGSGDSNLQTFVVPKCKNGGSSCPGDELRCVDGTRPIYHLDPADDFDPTDDLYSNKWLITFEGGGGCGSDGVKAGGEDCWDKYTDSKEDYESRKKMSSTYLEGGVPQPLGRTKSIGGILEDDVNHPFADYHRIKVSKCSFDRSTGTMSVTDRVGSFTHLGTIDDMPTNTIGSEFELHFHGARILKAILKDLKTTRTYDRILAGPAPGSTISTVLPGMKDADIVVLAGHSGGAIGLTHRLDLTANYIKSWGDIDVRGVFDALTKPPIDQVVFQATGSAGENVYDHNSGPATCDKATQDCLPAHGTGGGAVDESSYDESVYEPSTDGLGLDGGKLGNVHHYWGAVQDASCETFHSGDEEWRCNDPNHVAFNHTETPFFLRMAQLDDNSSNKAPDYALDPDYSFKDEHFRAYVTRSPLHFLEERDQALGDQSWHDSVYDWAKDPSVTAGATGIGAFYPDEITHGGLFNTTQFTDVILEDSVTGDCATYGSALKDWLEGTEQFWVEGAHDIVPGTTCP